MKKVQSYSCTIKCNPIVTLLIISGYSLILLTGRIIYTQSIQHIHLAWNLFLAWIPLLIALVIPYKNYMRYSDPIALILIFGWLLFFPNAPYIITDLIHLKKESDYLFLFDSLMIFSFAFSGLGLALYSLMIIRKIMYAMTSLWFTEVSILIFVVAGAYGIYLGRFLRWNSWDLFLNPKELLFDSISHLNNTIAIIITLLFSFLIYSAYLIFYNLNNWHYEKN